METIIWVLVAGLVAVVAWLIYLSLKTQKVAGNKAYDEYFIDSGTTTTQDPYQIFSKKDDAVPSVVVVGIDDTVRNVTLGPELNSITQGTYTVFSLRDMVIGVSNVLLLRYDGAVRMWNVTSGSFHSSFLTLEEPGFVQVYFNLGYPDSKEAYQHSLRHLYSILDHAVKRTAGIKRFTIKGIARVHPQDVEAIYGMLSVPLVVQTAPEHNCFVDLIDPSGIKSFTTSSVIDVRSDKVTARGWVAYQSSTKARKGENRSMMLGTVLKHNQNDYNMVKNFHQSATGLMTAYLTSAKLNRFAIPGTTNPAPFPWSTLDTITPLAPVITEQTIPTARTPIVSYRYEEDQLSLMVGDLEAASITNQGLLDGVASGVVTSESQLTNLDQRVSALEGASK